jgi:hypothetical protein
MKLRRPRLSDALFASAVRRPHAEAEGALHFIRHQSSTFNQQKVGHFHRCGPNSTWTTKRRPERYAEWFASVPLVSSLTEISPL